MILALLLLLTGLIISGVAIYYSVIGLTAIFSAAVLPIIIMGTTLEVAKLVGASWLKANWKRAPILIKTYMTLAVLVLMIITSMGIFGFLSKAHNDQTLVGGDVTDKIVILEERIKVQRENIDAARKALGQLDKAVDEVMARSTSEQGASRSATLRRNQAKDRAQLQTDVTQAQAAIAKLNEEKAVITKDLRKIEAEVGPIKYIAAMVYGDNPDANILEKAVTWVIIMIVAVFDPLAIVMLLAAQMSFQWRREDKNSKIDNRSKEKIEPTAPIVPPITTPTPEASVEQWNKMVEAAEKFVKEEKPAEPVVEEEVKTQSLSAYVTAQKKLSQVVEEAIDEESKKKAYMTKDLEGKIQLKNRE